MNKTETAYAQRLDLLAKAGEIAFWAFEAIKFRLADGAWYTPDFLVHVSDGTVSAVTKLEIHEVKGFSREAWGVRWKVAKDIYGGMFRFVLVRRGERGGWTFEE